MKLTKDKKFLIFIFLTLITFFRLVKAQNLLAQSNEIHSNDNQSTVSHEKCNQVSSGMKEILKRHFKKPCHQIKINEISNLKTLELSGKGLGEEEGQLLKNSDLLGLKIEDFDILEIRNKIEEIDLSYNRLTQLPDAFFKLPQLKILNVSKNRMTELYDQGEMSLSFFRYYYESYIDPVINFFPSAVNFFGGFFDIPPIEVDTVDIFYELTVPPEVFIKKERTPSHLDSEECLDVYDNSGGEYKTESFQIEPIDSEQTVTICEKVYDQDKTKLSKDELKTYAGKDFYPEWVDKIEEIYVEGNPLKGNPAFLYNADHLRQGMPFKKFTLRPLSWRSILEGWGCDKDVFTLEEAKVIQRHTQLLYGKVLKETKQIVWQACMAKYLYHAAYKKTVKEEDRNQYAEEISRFLNTLLLGQPIKVWRVLLEKQSKDQCVSGWGFGNLFRRLGPVGKNILGVFKVLGDNRASAMRWDLFPEDYFEDFYSPERLHVCKEDYYGQTYKFNDKGHYEKISRDASAFDQ